MTPTNSASTPLPKGFIPVMLTPFQESGAIDVPGLDRLTDFYLESGAIDVPGLDRLTDFYLESGAAGLFANCLSSEMYELTDAERVSVTKQVVARAGGRVPVVSTGTFGGPIEQQADFVKRIHDTGVHAVIAITSQLVSEQESDTVLLERIHQLMDLTDGVPLGMYECPVPYKRLITSEMLADLLPTGWLIYHKDTSLDADEVSRRLAVAQGYTFGLYDAYMVNAVSSLRAGAAGLCCIQGNLFPELISWLCAHFDDAARQDDVARLQAFFTSCMDLVHTAYPTIAKYSLQQQGLPMSLYTRRDVEPLTQTLRDDIDTLLKTVAQLRQELAIEPAMLVS